MAGRVEKAAAATRPTFFFLFGFPSILCTPFFFPTDVSSFSATIHYCFFHTLTLYGCVSSIQTSDSYTPTTTMTWQLPSFD